MNKILLMGALALSLFAAGGQTTPQKPGGGDASAIRTSDLAVFDLDFPGGSPQELVEALNQPLMGTLNVIIPAEYSDIQIPGLKMKKVTVAQVFDALQQASMKRVAYETGNPAHSGGFGGPSRRAVSEFTQSYGFLTTPPITENSVWSFRVERPALIPSQPTDKLCRYYQLGPYLQGLKIEDVTTAIKTGWDMLGVLGPQAPSLKFHPETKLLVAVGKESELAVIEDVLKELGKMPAKPARVNEVFVNGAVNKPGAISLPDEQKLTILDALARAGGLNNRADSRKIKFSRGNKIDKTLSFDDLKRENGSDSRLLLEPGDVIEVGDRIF